MSRILAIANTTWHQALRQPAYWIAVAVGATLIATSPAFALFGLGEEELLIADLGLPTILLCGVFLSISLSWATVTAEIEDQSALTLMAKPVRPITYVLGKYFGIVGALAWMVAGLTVVLVVTLRTASAVQPRFFGGIIVLSLLFPAGALLLSVKVKSLSRESWVVLGGGAGVLALACVAAVVGEEGGCPGHGSAHEAHGWRWDVAAAAALEGVELLVVAAVALALAVRVSLVPMASVTAAVVVVGNLNNYLFGRLGTVVGAGAWVFRIAVPNLDNFHMAEAVARERAVPMEALLWGGAYGVVYAAGVLAVAVWAFSGRELE